MRDCLIDQLDQILAALPLSKGVTFEDWYSDCADLDALTYGRIVEGVPVTRKDVAYAWGYLTGAADEAGVTMLEHLGNYNIYRHLTEESLAAVKPRKRQRNAKP